MLLYLWLVWLSHELITLAKRRCPKVFKTIYTFQQCASGSINNAKLCSNNCPINWGDQVCYTCCHSFMLKYIGRVAYAVEHYIFFCSKNPTLWKDLEVSKLCGIGRGFLSVSTKNCLLGCINNKNTMLAFSLISHFPYCDQMQLNNHAQLSLP